MPAIVAAVGVADRSGGAFFVGCVVQSGDLNGDEVAAENVEMASCERPHTARATEVIVHSAAAELVIGERLLALEQMEGGGLQDHIPRPHLLADRAIALARPRREIDLGLELDRAAMAASMVGF